MSVPELRLGQVVRWSLANARVATAAYLAIAIAVEVLRRWTGARWAERLALTFELLPATILRWCHVLRPIREAFLEGALNGLGVRFVYAVTTVAFIYALSFAIGGSLWAGARVARGRGRGTPIM